MNKYCPNKNLPEWKELVEVVGENKAYYLWDQNKGNGLDKTSNGEDSKLFSDLLNKFDRDRKQAILAKAETFTNAFKTQLSEELSKQVDNNGELLIEAYNKRYDTNLLGQLGEFVDTVDVVNFFINHKEVAPQTKNLLKYLNKVNRPFIIREGHKKGSRASSGSALYLYSDIIKKSSVQQNAEDVAHEMLHIYLRKEYDNNPKFRSELDKLQEKYRQKLGDSWYGLGLKDESDEFLNEFLSNSNLRSELQKVDKTLFQRIWETILGLIKNIFGKDTYRLPKDLLNAQTYAISLLNKVNQGEVSIYSVLDFPERYTGEEFNKLDIRQQEQIDKLYQKIQKGLKDRLNAVKHYSVKNPRTWNQITTLISQLSKSETEQGMLQFVQHVSDTIGDSIKFLSKPIDEINAKQIRQLSNDYLVL